MTTPIDTTTEAALLRLHLAWRGVLAAIDSQEQYPWATRAWLNTKHGVTLEER